MSPLAEQHTRVQEFTAVFTVPRLLTPLKMSYAVAQEACAPLQEDCRGASRNAAGYRGVGATRCYGYPDSLCLGEEPSR